MGKNNTARKGNGKGNTAQGAAAPQAPQATAAPQAKGPALDTTKRVKLLVPNCPKRPGTTCYTRAIKYWAKYAAGATVAECLEAGATRADIRWDVQHKFIELA